MGFNLQATRKAITSDFFWAYLAMLLEVSGLAEFLSSWAEGCPCRGPFGTPCVPPCAFKGCRAGELAAGFHKQLMAARANEGHQKLVLFCTQLRPEQASELVADWAVARSRMELEVELKLAFYDGLPWKLFGLSMCANIFVMRDIGRVCQSLWRKLTPLQQRTSHPMTRRFCDPAWLGVANHFDPAEPPDPLDPPLADALDSYIHGAMSCFHDNHVLNKQVFSFGWQ
jgi:hypothetical protein